MKTTEGKALKSSIIISFFTLLTSVFNYLALFLLAFTFGTRMEMDAFFAAVTIPQIITAILLATLSTTFIPVFVEVKAIDESRAWRLASISVNLIFSLLLIVALTGCLLSKNVISLVTPGLPDATSNLASSLFILSLISVVFSGTSILFNSLYYAHHRFVKAPFFQFLSSFVTFLFVIFFRTFLGIQSILIGTLMGSLIQFLALLPILRARYSLSFNFREKEIVKLVRLAIPLLIGSIFYRSNTLVERFLASRLGEGSISYLGYAYKIIIAMVLLLNQGISTVLFPRMSEYSAHRDYEGLKDILSKGIRALIIVTVPVLFVVIFARSELVQVIFERGHFTPHDTIAVSKALLAYLAFFAVSTISLPIVNTLYSLQETFKVAAVGIFGFILYILLALLLSSCLSYVGIALAVSIQYFISLIFFIFIIRTKLGKFGSKPLFRCVFKSVLSSGLASAVIFCTSTLLTFPLAHPFDLLVYGIIGFVVYVLFLKVLKTEELHFISFKISPWLR